MKPLLPCLHSIAPLNIIVYVDADGERMTIMEIIDLTLDNLASEHICCSLSDKKGESCAASKKVWLAERFKEGLVFKKLAVRGKVFIEYLPAEKAWCPLDAPGAMFINCFWVSGQFAGKGYGKRLLEACITDAKAKGKTGLAVLSSAKKKPFLSDPGFLKSHGFQACDFAAPYFELLHLPLVNDAKSPSFKECCKKGVIKEKGFVLYYSNQCPHTEKYAPALVEIAHENGTQLTLRKFISAVAAQKSPTPFTTYGLFREGKFVTNEILSQAKFAKLLTKAL